MALGAISVIPRTVGKISPNGSDNGFTGIAAVNIGAAVLSIPGLEVIGTGRWIRIFDLVRG